MPAVERDRNRRWWLVAGLAAVWLAVALVLLLGLNMRRGLNHDEHQFVASAALLARQNLLPYRDFPYFHVPTLSLVYALIFQFTDYLLLGARWFSVICSWLTLALLLAASLAWLRNMRPAGRLLVGVLVTLLLMNAPTFLHASGRAWNHDFPTLLTLLAAFLQATWLKRSRRPVLWLLAIGFLVGLATGVRVSFALVAPAFIAAVFIGLNWRRRAAWTGLLLLGIGALAGAAPALYLFWQAPAEFIFGNLTYAQLNTAYYAQLGSATAAMSLGEKLAKTAEYTFLQPGNLFLVLLAGIALWRIRARIRLRSAPDVVFLLLLLPFLLAGAFAPTPIQPQYIYVLFPHIALLFLAALAYDGRPLYALWATGVAAAVAALLAIPRYAEGAEIVFDPSEWLPLKVHARGEYLGELAGHAPILTLAPIYPLEGGAPIYPEFVTGPMGWRVATLLTPEERTRFDLVGIDDLEAHLAAAPPRAILTGIHDNDIDVEEPLLAYVQEHGYVPVALPEEGTLWLTRQADWAGQIALGAALLPASPLAPGDPLLATLYLQALAPIARDLNVLVRVVAPDGSELLRDEGWPWGRPTSSWAPGDVWPDGHSLTIPPDAAPGPYRVEVSFYDPATLELTGDPVGVGYVVVAQEDGAAVSQTPLATFGDGLTLLAAAVPAEGWSAGAAPVLQLTWRADTPARGRYTTFVHVVGPNGLVAQHDQEAQGGFYPTAAWLQSVPVTDRYPLTLPEDLPAGDYQILIGLYDPATGQRLPVLENGAAVGDAFTAATVQVR